MVFVHETSKMSDAELIDCIQSDYAMPDERKNAFNQLYQKHSASLLRYITQQTNADVAHDIFGEVWVVACKKLSLMKKNSGKDNTHEVRHKQKFVLSRPFFLSYLKGIAKKSVKNGIEQIAMSMIMMTRRFILFKTRRLLMSTL